MMKRIWVAWMIGVSAGFVHAGEVTISNLQELIQLPRARAESGLPVTVQGVVTCLNDVDGFFMHGDGADAYVGRARKEKDKPVVERLPDLKPGSRVEVTGITEPGGYKPMIRVKNVRVLGVGELPEARKISLNLLTSGNLDCSLVKVEGVVQGIQPTAAGNAPCLLMSFGGIPGFVQFLPQVPFQSVESYVDARVEVEGVLAVLNNLRGEMVGLRILSAGLDHLSVVERPPEDPFKLEPVPLDQLDTFNVHGWSEHRILTSGTVTYQKPGGFIVIQDGFVATRVGCGTEERFLPGERVMVAGFRELSRPVAGMTQSLVRRVGMSEVPAPLRITVDEILQTQNFLPRRNRPLTDCDYRLVTLTATLKEVNVVGDSAQVLLEQAGSLFSASLEVSRDEAHEVRRWARDSVIEVTGVCELEYSGSMPAVENARAVKIGLISRSPADFRIVKAASWWTRDRLGIAAAVATILLSLISIWNFALRRRVAAHAHALSTALKDQHDVEMEFEAERRERRRLAGDLHDMISQGIAAASMQLDAAQLYQGRDPELATSHSASARELLTRCGEDVRRSLWGLRADALDGRSFSQALASLVRRLTNGTSLETRVDCPSDFADSVPDFIAGNLLILAQEAVSNTLRHASATSLSVTCQPDHGGVRMIIEDDGAGFALTRSSVREGHFGLETMRERVERLRGTFDLQSSPESGTKITVHVPAETIELAAELSRA